MPILLLRQLTLHIISTLLRRHLTRINPGRNRIDPDLDPLIRDLGREHLGQVDRRRFAGVVREMALRFEHDAWDRSDIDDRAGVAMQMLRCALQQRQERPRHEVELRNVGAVLRRPVVKLLALGMEQVVVELLGRFTARRHLARGLDPRVVDQDTEIFLLRLDFFGHAQDVLLVGHVAYERDDLTRDALAVRLGNGGELLFRASDDVDFRAVVG